MNDERFEERLEREIRQRVEEELKRARTERERYRQEMRRHQEDVEREPRAPKGGHNAGVPHHIPLPDVDKVGDLLGIVAEKIPALLGGLRDLLYSPAAAENMADSVAAFYTKLRDAGIPEDKALQMAQGYMFNLRDVLGKKGLDLGRFARDEE